MIVAARGQGPSSDALSEVQALTRQITDLVNRGQALQALPLATRAVEISESKFGADHALTGMTLGLLADVNIRLGKPEEAGRQLERAVRICEQRLGPDHATVAALVVPLGTLYFSRGDDARAEPLLERALATNEKVNGREHDSNIPTLLILAHLHVRNGRFKTAVTLQERALSIWQSRKKPEDQQCADILLSLCSSYCAKGEYATARPLVERALTICERVLPPNSETTCLSLGWLYTVCSVVGDHPTALALVKRLVRIYEGSFGPEDDRTLQALTGLAHEYKCAGELKLSEAVYQRALTIEKRRGRDTQIARLQVGLASVYTASEEHSRARSTLNQALRVQEVTLGPDHLETAATLAALGSTCMQGSDYEAAELFARRALAIYDKRSPTFGTTPEQWATTNSYTLAQSTLAWVCVMKGDRREAARLERRSLELYRKVAMSEDNLTLLRANHLASLVFDTDPVEARKILEYALEIADRMLGPDHEVTAVLTTHLASTCSLMDDSSRATELTNRALSSFAKGTSWHWTTKIAVGAELSFVLSRGGRMAEGIELLERTQALSERKNGVDSPLIEGTLEILALDYAIVGRVDDALTCKDRAIHIRDRLLAQLFLFSTDRLRLQLQSQPHLFELYGSLGDASRVARTVLKRKGLVLDANLRDRELLMSATSPVRRERLKTLQSLRARLRTPLSPVAGFGITGLRSAEDRRRLEAEAEELEGIIVRDLGDRDRIAAILRVTPAVVQAALPHSAALVEYVRYRHLTGGGRYEERFGAVILLSTAEAIWVGLGEAREIDDLVDKYQSEVRRDEVSRLPSQLGQILASLHVKVWAPVQKKLPQSVHRVYISPEGSLNQVSFATLLDTAGRFLVEGVDVEYVASGRDLVRNVQGIPTSELALFANPAFASDLTHAGARSPALDSKRLPLTKGSAAPAFTPLPGTAAEAEVLSQLAASAGLKTHVFTEGKASKAAFTQLRAPKWLHVATHGFFLAAPDTSREGSTLQSSGLAFAGAQRTAEAWSHGTAVPSDNDGILTSEEIAFLDLRGTELVVLSACDTGMGQVVAGEGVLGLKRAFVQAGAKNLLVTLWPIPDSSTVGFMKAFYQRVLSGVPPGTALSSVQREWLTSLRDKEGLRKAVVSSGPFVLSVQGRP